jgi:hypothetical protein
MKHPAIKLSALFIGLVFLCFVALESETVARSVGWVEMDPGPVLVFTIPDSASLARVRAAVGDERIVFENDDGFALKGGRIYVNDPRQAGEFIKSGGWVEKPIKIVSLGMDAGVVGDPTPAEARLSRDERMTRLRQLVHKPSLTRGEQIFVLQAMNDGLEI